MLLTYIDESRTVPEMIDGLCWLISLVANVAANIEIADASLCSNNNNNNNNNNKFQRTSVSTQVSLPCSC